MSAPICDRHQVALVCPCCQAARAGAVGGRATSARKAAAAAANGAKGGRPVRPCDVCGTREHYCTNDRCRACHRAYCTPGGSTGRGHGRGYPPTSAR